MLLLTTEYIITSLCNYAFAIYSDIEKPGFLCTRITSGTMSLPPGQTVVVSGRSIWMDRWFPLCSTCRLMRSFLRMDHFQVEATVLLQNGRGWAGFGDINVRQERQSPSWLRYYNTKTAAKPAAGQLWHSSYELPVYVVIYISRFRQTGRKTDSIRISWLFQSPSVPLSHCIFNEYTRSCRNYL